MIENRAPVSPSPVSATGTIQIFGYGSLMWDPGFDHMEALPARVLGWHRRFSLVSTIAWGTRAAPGLCASLHPGGRAWGRVFCIGAHNADNVVAYLDQREAAYHAREVCVEVRANDGLYRSRARTYVANPGHPRLRAGLSDEDQKKLVRQGVGQKGSSLVYAQKTAAALSEDGHFDTDAHRFLAMIER